MTKLTPAQQKTYTFLCDHGVWYAGCGWALGTPKHTQERLNTLVEKGKARMDVEGKRAVYRPLRAGYQAYVVEYAGGFGPGVWHSPERIIMAKDFRDASRKALAEVDAMDCPGADVTRLEVEC